MKKVFFFIIFFFSFVVQSSFASGTVDEMLNSIEKTYYGYTYSDGAENRLRRLEKNVYGSQDSNSKLTHQARVEKLYKDLAVGESVTSASSQGTSFDLAQDIGPKADEGIKYPIVDKMEQKVFNKTFLNDDIYNRLSRLEKQTFGNNYKKNTQSLNERVDVLRNKILGGTKTAAVYIDPSSEEIILENGQRYYGESKQNLNDFDGLENSHYNYYSYENSKNRIPNTQTSSDYDSENGLTGNDDAYSFGQSYDLDLLEKSLLGKKYSSETPSRRLARLESRVFSRTFSDSEQDRIQRLLAVTTAQKTSQEYDSNKWARRLNAGLQIGGIILMVLCMIL